MRYAFAIMSALVLVTPGTSEAQLSLDGFGALSMNQLSSFGESRVPADFGGRIAFDLVPGVQAIGEFGRLGSVLPPLVALPLSFLPRAPKVSAFYGEGGIRLLAAPESRVSPYVEGTAGMAHLRLGISGLGPTADVIARTALNFVGTREPMIGGGGGVLLGSGPIHVDLGYRYKKILTDSVMGSILSAGQQLQTHQLRMGVGVRF